MANVKLLILSNVILTTQEDICVNENSKDSCSANAGYFAI